MFRIHDGSVAREMFNTLMLGSLDESEAELYRLSCIDVVCFPQRDPPTIPKVPRNQKRASKAEIVECYIIQKMTIKETSVYFKVCVTTLRKWMAYHHIKSRNGCCSREYKRAQKKKKLDKLRKVWLTD